jgi:hypothetical protein
MMRKWTLPTAPTNGSVLNEDMNAKSGNSFTFSTVIANSSSFASLTDIFMSSHFDIQDEDSSSKVQHFIKCMSEMYILGEKIKIDEIEYISQDASASLSLSPIGLVETKVIFWHNSHLADSVSYEIHCFFINSDDNFND